MVRRRSTIGRFGAVEAGQLDQACAEFGEFEHWTRARAEGFLVVCAGEGRQLEVAESNRTSITNRLVHWQTLMWLGQQGLVTTRRREGRLLVFLSPLGLRVAYKVGYL